MQERQSLPFCWAPFLSVGMLVVHCFLPTWRDLQCDSPLWAIGWEAFTALTVDRLGLCGPVCRCPCSTSLGGQLFSCYQKSMPLGCNNVPRGRHDQASTSCISWAKCTSWIQGCADDTSMVDNHHGCYFGCLPDVCMVESMSVNWWTAYISWLSIIITCGAWHPAPSHWCFSDWWSYQFP